MLRTPGLQNHRRVVGNRRTVIETELTTAAAVSNEKRFVFGRDTFAFSNELVWDYTFAPETGKMICKPRVPKPSYTHHCFVVVKAARKFFYHARFDAAAPRADAETYRKLTRKVLARNPRVIAKPGERVVIPGYDCLAAFSAAHEVMLKSECGGAWQSYVLRSHWRMVFPISREHQERTAAGLVEKIGAGAAPIAHIVNFPKITINHGVGFFDVAETANGWNFATYDPNDHLRPTLIAYDKKNRQFSMAGNGYYIGGPLNVIEIFTSWWM